MDPVEKRRLQAEAAEKRGLEGENKRPKEDRRESYKEKQECDGRSDKPESRNGSIFHVE